MIVELRPTESTRVLPLYRMAGMSFPLISAVIQNKQRGQIFTDEQEKPSAALIVTNFGFMFFAGGEENAAFDAGLKELFITQALKPSYLLWYSPPLTWQRKFEALGPDNFRRRERVRLEYRSEFPANATLQTPSGFELKNLTLDLIPKTERFGVQLDSRFWASADDFLENGLGVCLVANGEVASLCYSAAIVDGLAEVDVATDPDFRGRGLGTVVTNQFIKECMGRGVVPTWDCFEYNTASIMLARKLGFIETVRYPFYSFNTPLRFPGHSNG